MPARRRPRSIHLATVQAVADIGTYQWRPRGTKSSLKDKRARGSTPQKVPFGAAQCDARAVIRRRPTNVHFGSGAAIPDRAANLRFAPKTVIQHGLMFGDICLGQIQTSGVPLVRKHALRQTKAGDIAFNKPKIL
jgi:hypothetical protein